jgi:hypothetical protein
MRRTQEATLIAILTPKAFAGSDIRRRAVVLPGTRMLSFWMKLAHGFEMITSTDSVK